MTLSGNLPTVNSPPFDSGTVQSVVEHMNSDHADACLSIVRAFSEHGDAALQTQLIGVDREGLLFEVRTHADNVSANNQNVRVNFPKPLRTEEQIRGALVGMTRQARQKLAD